VGATEYIVACVRRVVTLVKPEHYLVQRVAESYAFAIVARVADATLDNAVRGRYAVDKPYLVVGRKPQPHRQVIGKPLGVLVGSHLGIVLLDKVATGHRS
jgi:hypothetical protein